MDLLCSDSPAEPDLTQTMNTALDPSESGAVFILHFQPRSLMIAFGFRAVGRCRKKRSVGS